MIRQLFTSSKTIALGLAAMSVLSLTSIANAYPYYYNNHPFFGHPYADNHPFFGHPYWDHRFDHHRDFDRWHRWHR